MNPPNVTSPFLRAVRQIQEAQTESDRLQALIATSANAGSYIRDISKRLAEALALAEASMLAAMPHTSTHLTLSEKPPADGNLWLDLSAAERLPGA